MDQPNVMMEGCSNETLQYGMCWGYSVCGFCYGYLDEGQSTASSTYDHFNLVVIGVLLPLIGLLGLVGDCLSAFVYSRREMHSSLNVYLCALAFSDIIIILTSFFLFFLENMRKRSLRATTTFALLAPFMFPLGLTAQSLSVFLTVTAAFDCFILVAASPKIKSTCCTVKASLRMLVVIILLAMMYNAPHLFEIYVIDCWSLPYKQPSKDVCPTELRTDSVYVSIYYAWMYTIVMAGGPFVLLIILNSAIIVIIRRKGEEAESSDGDVTTLVLVVCLFVTCNILPLTVNLLEMVMSLENPYLIDLSNLMVVLNSSCNFLIYYTFSSSFRRTLKNHMRHLVMDMSRYVMCIEKNRSSLITTSFHPIPSLPTHKEYLI